MDFERKYLESNKDSKEIINLNNPELDFNVKDDNNSDNKYIK